MKKKLKFIFLLIIIIFCYYKFVYLKEIKRVIEKTEEETFYIEKYTIFGTHFNISGCINKTIGNDLELVLKNTKEEIVIESNFNIEDNKTCFILSDKNNEGINLDELKLGKYTLLVKEKNKYYSLKNNTDYKNLEYYTITKNNKNNKININFNKYKQKNYLEIDIIKSILPKDVYDITIDPGHGGNDIGASYKLKGKTYTEADLTLKISLLLKEELERLGLKVKLTRDNDIYLDSYGDNGRAVIPNEASSKYSLSLHLNSAEGTMRYGGVEVYTPNDINYEFASYLADNISEIVNYSKKTTDKISNGVYFTSFTKQDIIESKQDMLEDNMNPYDIKVGSPYMYMIREVGGINTNAYIDGRNEKYGLNKYYNSNQTSEPYLIELGYINYKKDLENIVNKSDAFSKAISNSIKQYLNIK